MPLNKICHWADFHEIHADRQCSAKVSYTEFHENPTNSSIVKTSKQLHICLQGRRSYLLRKEDVTEKCFCLCKIRGAL